MKKPIFVIVFLLIAASAAMAATLNLTNLPGLIANGHYVGPSTGNLDGGTPFKLVCNDFADTSYIPSSFSVNVSTIPSLVYAMYADRAPSGPTAIQIATYEQAAILLSQMDRPEYQNSGDIGGLQFAIWRLFNQSVPNWGTSASWIAWVQGQDLTAWTYDDVRIYTPPVLGSNQEFMSGAAATPEPAVLGLVGLGLIGFGVFRKFKLRRQ